LFPLLRFTNSVSCCHSQPERSPEFSEDGSPAHVESWSIALNEVLRCRYSPQPSTTSWTESPGLQPGQRCGYGVAQIGSPSALDWSGWSTPQTPGSAKGFAPQMIVESRLRPSPAMNLGSPSSWKSSTSRSWYSPRATQMPPRAPWFGEAFKSLSAAP